MAANLNLDHIIPFSVFYDVTYQLVEDPGCPIVHLFVNDLAVRLRCTAERPEFLTPVSIIYRRPLTAISLLCRS